MDYKKQLYIPIVSTLLLTILAITIFHKLLTDWLESHTEKELESQLVASIALLKQHKSTTASSLESNMNTIPMTHSEHRYTIINQDGKVLADSSLPAASLMTIDNHKFRPEINSALTHGYGSSIRFSRTLDLDLIYVAQRFQLNELIGVLRIAAPISKLRSSALELTFMLITLMSLVLITMIVLAIFTHQSIHLQIQENMRRQEETLKERTQKVELLQRLTSMLAACNSIEEAEQVIEDVIPRILGQLNGAISLINNSQKQLNIVINWGGEWPGATSCELDDCWGLRKGKSHLSNDELTRLPCPHMSAVSNDQTLCIPLTAQGQAIGVMHIYLDKDSISDERLKLCFTVAEHIGLALANLILHEKLLDLTIKDPLTSLYNRHYLEESMEQEFMRAKRQSCSFSILAIDLDSFKKFNDQHGHDAGNYALKLIGNLISTSIRGEDIPCRVGGEAFSILLPGANSNSASLVAEKLCHLVRNLPLSFHRELLEKLTVSIGIATYPEHALDANSLLKQADAALYYAKENGKDQHCFAHSTITTKTVKQKVHSTISHITRSHLTKTPQPTKNTKNENTTSTHFFSKIDED